PALLVPRDRGAVLPVLARAPRARVLAVPPQRTPSAVGGRCAHARLLPPLRGRDGHLPAVDLLLPAHPGVGAGSRRADGLPAPHRGRLAAPAGDGAALVDRGG